jgi:lysophospholipid acyltransferase (LPLAT)-like uncharacterized protein
MALPKRHQWRYRLMKEVGTALVSGYLRFVNWSSRKTIFNPEDDPWLNGSEGAIYSAFHQGILIDAIQVRGRGGVVMVSRSKDGEIGTRFCDRFGWTTVRGSSGRGGKDAFAEMTQRLREERTLAGMVCDGPRGPYGIPKLGTVHLARATGLPITPVSGWSTRQIRLKTWDRTLIPLPFGHIYFAFGEPIRVPADASDGDCEYLCQVLGDRIAELLFRCQEAAGDPPEDLRPREPLLELRARSRKRDPAKQRLTA